MKGLGEAAQVDAGLLREISMFARDNGVRRVILFGSRARGEARARSDVDLAAQGGSVAGFALDLIEKSSTLLSFDVVSLGDSVSPGLAGEIERDGIVVYEHEEV